ncbi:MAG: hypothetical protein HY917_00595 [Candidatus Diapherotrites archaeon]|nr:hypothetical protein [Candidatus Diapherotrites archaeon]
MPQRPLLGGKPTHPNTARHSMPGTPVPKSTHNEIIRLGALKDPQGKPVHSLHAIAAKTKVSHGFVSWLLDEKGIRKGSSDSPGGMQTRKKVRDAEPKIIGLGSMHDIQTRRPVFSMRKIAKNTGVSYPTVLRKLQKANIERNEMRGRPTGPKKTK